MKRYDFRNLWKKDYSKAADLSGFPGLTEEEIRQMEKILDRFPMRITPYYLSLIDWDKGEEDPIRKMCIPSVRETDLSGSFDTSGEESNTIMRGLQHKYHQTALILSTHECAMYCRHCFRKRLVGTDRDAETRGSIADMADYVAAHPEISNVLITGGDALMNRNPVIREYLDRFSRIETLDFIRFGSRLPVVLPERIYEDEELLSMLADYGKKKQIFVVTQFNHPREITEESSRAVKALMAAGTVLRNQTVLLKGVNDDPEILGGLMKKLTAIGVLPYYVFQCRPVAGVKNQFQVPILKGLDIVKQAKNLQNGQGKGIRYCMSHPLGKIELIGKLESAGQSDQLPVLMQFHQAKYDKDAGRIFTVGLDETDCWLYDRHL